MVTKMTELIFQFVPTHAKREPDVEINEKSPSIRSVTTITEGFTVIELKSKEKLEVDKFGNLRITFNYKSLSESHLEKVYKKAFKLVTEIVEMPEKQYRVCLLLRGDDSTTLYLNESEIIEEFAIGEFGTEPKFSELNDKTVKVSLSSEGKKVTV